MIVRNQMENQTEHEMEATIKDDIGIFWEFPEIRVASIWIPKIL